MVAGVEQIFFLFHIIAFFRILKGDSDSRQDQEGDFFENSKIALKIALSKFFTHSTLSSVYTVSVYAKFSLRGIVG